MNSQNSHDSNHQHNLDESCPNCGKEKFDDASCPFCGIVFSRYRRSQKPSSHIPPKEIKPKIGVLGVFALGRYARFFRQLAKMIGAGMPLNSSLEKLRESHPSLNHPLQKTIAGLDQGLSLIHALASSNFRFPQFVWAHIEAGEFSGNLETLLHSLANELETRRRWIMQQLFNFRTLWLIAIFIFAALSLSVTETVRHLDPQLVDKGQVAILTGIGKGALGRFSLYFIFIATCIIAFALYQIKWKHMLIQRFSKMEMLHLKTPLFGQISQLEAWRRYLSLLAKLLESGLPLQKALYFSQQDSEFPSWRKGLGTLQNTLDRGGSLGDGFRKLPFAPKSLAIEIEVGTSTGTLPESLRKDAVAMEEKLNQLRNLAQIVFLVASIFMGAVLTILIFARGLGAWLPLYEKVLYD